jgi:hypothetical protein
MRVADVPQLVELPLHDHAFDVAGDRRELVVQRVHLATRRSESGEQRGHGET